MNPPLRQLLRRAERQLTGAGIGDPKIEADLVWMTALEVDRVELYARLSDSPTDAEQAAADALLARRLRHEPAAYIMGRREFFGIELVVAPGVLIPRPDTEVLVEEALRFANARTGPLRIADVGCGSGAITVALALHLPDARVYAIDISQRAIEIAVMNADRQGVADRVETLRGDLLAPLTRTVDLITANLPYVESAAIPTLEPEIRMWEPREALDGGDDGLDLIRRLLASAPERLARNGAMVLECDPGQVPTLRALAAETFPGASVETVVDLAGRERVVAVRR
jgi:release factor glutamine methyltransferase